MDTRIVTLEPEQTLSLPLEATSALGLQEGSKLTVSVQDGKILLQPLLADDLDQLCGMFSSNKGSEEDLYELRRQEEENFKRKFGC